MAGSGDDGGIDLPAFVARFEEHDESLVRLARLLVDDRGRGEEQRECLVLRYDADLSEAEIAATLAISPGSVTSHSSRGMAAPRRAFGDDT